MTLREMMMGSGESFDYFQCSQCGTIQIADIPADLGKYYAGSYYSFSAAIDRRPAWVRRSSRLLTRRAIDRPSFTARGRWFERLDSWEMKSYQLEAVGRAHPRSEVRILEVGCGSGRTLDRLVELGFSNTVGVDPFLPADSERRGVSLRRADVTDLPPSDSYDLILLYHSFEHVKDPRGVLRAVATRLSANGTVVVAMPIVADAYRRYGPDWFQLDPPRHLHIFTEPGFDQLARETGLEVFDRYYNSTAAQFRISEEAARRQPRTPTTLPYSRPVRYLLTERRWRSEARLLNRKGLGDQAVFLLRAAPSPPPGGRG